MMRKTYLWGLVAILLTGALCFWKAVSEKDWSGFGVVGISAGLLSSRRAAAHAEAGLTEKRGVPPIDAVVPATQQTATFALG
jgi:hypothetical protein